MKYVDIYGGTPFNAKKFVSDWLCLYTGASFVLTAMKWNTVECRIHSPVPIDFFLFSFVAAIRIILTLLYRPGVQFPLQIRSGMQGA